MTLEPESPSFEAKTAIQEQKRGEGQYVSCHLAISGPNALS